MLNKGDIVVLEILAIQGRNLPNKDFFKKQDPFLVFYIGDQNQRTKVDKNGGTRPEWNNRIRFERLRDPVETIMKIKCFDDEWKRKEQFIGECAIDLGPVYKNGDCDGWFKLYDRGNPAGEVYLELTFFTKDGIAKKYSQTIESISLVPDKTPNQPRPLSGSQQLKSQASTTTTNSVNSNLSVIPSIETKAESINTPNSEIGSINQNIPANNVDVVNTSSTNQEIPLKSTSPPNVPKVEVSHYIPPKQKVEHKESIATSPQGNQPLKSTEVLNNVEALSNNLQHMDINKPATLSSIQLNNQQHSTHVGTTIVTSPEVVSPTSSINLNNPIASLHNVNPSVNKLENQYHQQVVGHHQQKLDEAIHTDQQAINKPLASGQSSVAGATTLNSVAVPNAQFNQNQDDETPDEKPQSSFQMQLKAQLEARKKKQAEQQNIEFNSIQNNQLENNDVATQQQNIKKDEHTSQNNINVPVQISTNLNQHEVYSHQGMINNQPVAQYTSTVNNTAPITHTNQQPIIFQNQPANQSYSQPTLQQSIPAITSNIVQTPSSQNQVYNQVNTADQSPNQVIPQQNQSNTNIIAQKPSVQEQAYHSAQTANQTYMQTPHQQDQPIINTIVQAPAQEQVHYQTPPPSQPITSSYNQTNTQQSAPHNSITNQAITQQQVTHQAQSLHSEGVYPQKIQQDALHANSTTSQTTLNQQQSYHQPNSMKQEELSTQQGMYDKINDVKPIQIQQNNVHPNKPYPASSHQNESISNIVPQANSAHYQGQNQIQSIHSNELHNQTNNQHQIHPSNSSQTQYQLPYNNPSQVQVDLNNSSQQQSHHKNEHHPIKHNSMHSYSSVSVNSHDPQYPPENNNIASTTNSWQEQTPPKHQNSLPHSAPYLSNSNVYTYQQSQTTNSASVQPQLHVSTSNLNSNPTTSISQVHIQSQSQINPTLSQYKPQLQSSLAEQSNIQRPSGTMQQVPYHTNYAQAKPTVELSTSNSNSFYNNPNIVYPPSNPVYPPPINSSYEQPLGFVIPNTYQPPPPMAYPPSKYQNNYQSSYPINNNVPYSPTYENHLPPPLPNKPIDMPISYANNIPPPLPSRIQNNPPPQPNFEGFSFPQPGQLNQQQYQQPIPTVNYNNYKPFPPPEEKKKKKKNPFAFLDF